MRKRIDISSKDLRDLYQEQQFTTYQIARMLGCCQATVWKKLRELDIIIRLPGANRVNIAREQLHNLYVNKKLSTRKIAKELKIPHGTIHRKLKEFNIATRDLSSANIKNFRFDFSGDLIEKSYLIGFRLGDLGVRKICHNSKTITVASGSTIKDQITLIKNLFCNYGKVSIKETRSGKLNIWVALNESFDFLLNREVPNWAMKKKELFFSFLAGFTDAEGSIKIRNGMAQYSLGNYNKSLLSTIRSNLIKYGIQVNTLVTDERKGTKNSQGYTYRNNYSTLRICKKDDLLKLLLKLSKYSKHPNRIKDLNIALANIYMRNSNGKKR